MIGIGCAMHNISHRLQSSNIIHEKAPDKTRKRRDD
jgi:hypothetical protein